VADPGRYWNEADRTTYSTEDPREAGVQRPAGSSRALALVHLAMHDADFGINPEYEPYLGTDLTARYERSYLRLEDRGEDLGAAQE
jgi:hypothetical protein